jgi:hypothetical protein
VVFTQKFHTIFVLRLVQVDGVKLTSTTNLVQATCGQEALVPTKVQCSLNHHVYTTQLMALQASVFSAPSLQVSKRLQKQSQKSHM